LSGAALVPNAPGVPSARPGRQRRSWAWLGVIPFLAFSLAFMIIPTFYLVVGSFVDSTTGAPTLQNYIDLGGDLTKEAYLNSIEISLVTAIGGAVFGFLLAFAVISGGLPRWIRGALMTFSGVASNFAGIPLALAFTFTLGRTGLVTTLLVSALGIDLYHGGFTLYSKFGIELAYMYFQFPLMVLIIAPAIDGLRRDWREASENMGASTFQYWRYVALPILTPSILGATILLFGNAFGAQATAYQLYPLANIVPVVIGRQLSGDVLHNPGLGFALAMGMVVIMGITIFLYTILQRRSERWLRR
jgi:putative spermidine/putrescine transport system permease protein